MSTDKTRLTFRVPDKVAAEILDTCILMIAADDAQENPPDDPEVRRARPRSRQFCWACFLAKVDADRLLGELAQVYVTSMVEAQERVANTCCKYRDQDADLTDDSVVEEIASAYYDALYLLGKQEGDESTDGPTAADVTWNICDSLLTPLIECAAMALDIDPAPIMLFHEAPTPENRPGAMVVARKLLYATEALPSMSAEEANAKAHELLEADPTFADKSQRDWAREIGCSPTLAGNLTLRRAVMRRRPKGRKPKTVALTDKLEATIGKDDEALQVLLGEQQADDEPSPLEGDDPGSFTSLVKVRR